MDYFDEPIKSVHAGRFHSIFLTESGKLYGLGYNKYGQIGISNSLYAHAEEPVEIYVDDLEIEEISVGAHHNLILDKAGQLYGFGARMNGQIDGVSYEGREEQPSIVEIALPNGAGGPNSRITAIQARNVRS